MKYTDCKEKVNLIRYSHLKKIVVFLFVWLITLSGSLSLAQDTKLNLLVKNKPLGEVLNLLEQKTGYSFLVRSSDVDLKQLITVEADKKSLSEILTLLFNSKNIRFDITGKSVSIYKPQKSSEITPVSAPVKSRRISGLVLDEKGFPVIGASVIVPGTTIGVATDLEGRFNFEAPVNEKIRISYIGYNTKEEVIKENTNLIITLEPIQKTLDEIVITAQAIGQKQAINQQILSNTLKNVISAEKLQQNPDVNAIEAIGRLPGISVNRSGGEGAGFLLRGLDQSYSTVLINGEPLPVGLNVISTYALQGVDVYKSLTANLEGNAVAGSVDLTLRATPRGLNYSVMAQSGYNALNNDYANYNFVAQVSNRFLNDRLGVFLSVNADRVNRSTSVMRVGYNTNYTTNLGDPFYISNINFNLNERINFKQSAVVNVDFIASSSTLLGLQTFLSASNFYASTQSKSFNPEGNTASVPIAVNMSETPEYRNYGITSIFSGKTRLRFLSSVLNYGVSFTRNKTSTPGSQSWSYTSETRANGLHRDSLKVYTPAQVARNFDDILVNLQGTQLETMTYSQLESNNLNVSPRLDFEIPFRFFKDKLHGKLQLGAKYRYNTNYVDWTNGVGYAGNNAIFREYINKQFGWVENKSVVPLVVEGQENNFLGGAYSFGDRYSFVRNNIVFDAWQQNGKEKYLSGSTGGLGDDPKYSGFVYNLNSSAMNDINNRQHYLAGYIMPEINIGNWLMVMPGFRYEYQNAQLHGYRGNEVTRTYSVFENLSSAYGLRDSISYRTDKFLLPMIHIRLKPTKWFYTHFSYTHTIRRPSSGVSPFEYYSAQDASSYTYNSGNPGLRTELWKSYDLQFTFHGNKFGLFSVTGFNKSVEDKLWARSYKRIQGEPIPHPVFKDNDLVNMTVYENHPYEIVLRGVEVEWQNSFGYLPKPFSYMTLSVNYTYTNGKSPNPYTRLYKYKPAGSRYELTGRQDSVVIEPMTGMPAHMANVTLGMEIKGFKTYISYQYAAQKIQSTHPNDLRLYVMNEPYSRVDFNASYSIYLQKNDILEVLFKIGNLTNSEDRIRYRDETRPISVEQYGVTADLGIRYKF